MPDSASLARPKSHCIIFMSTVKNLWSVRSRGEWERVHAPDRGGTPHRRCPRVLDDPCPSSPPSDEPCVPWQQHDGDHDIRRRIRVRVSGSRQGARRPQSDPWLHGSLCTLAAPGATPGQPGGGGVPRPVWHRARSLLRNPHAAVTLSRALDDAGGDRPDDREREVILGRDVDAVIPDTSCR